MSGTAVQKAQQEEKEYSALELLSGELESEMQEVNSLILEKLESPVTMIPEVAKHLIMAGGKRIRPLLLLACSKLFKPHEPRAVSLAVVVEFLHSATLLHDDVVDEGDYRRGKITANRVWGNQASVLVGDFLFTRSFQLMTQDGCPEVLHVLSNASYRIAEGEVLQLMTCQKKDFTREKYFDIIEAKTAILFAAATKLGGIVCDRSVAEKEALNEYGRNIGLVFQIIDDLLDYMSPVEEIGKEPGNDFREGKVTLPVILAYETLSDSEKEKIETLFNKPDKTKSDFLAVKDILSNCGITQLVLQHATFYANKAKKNLENIPDSSIKSLLKDLIDYCITRSF